MQPKIVNRVTELLRTEYPIVQAPMGWIARAQLRLGEIECVAAWNSSRPPPARPSEIKQEIRTMRSLTDKPFGVNIALAFVRDPGIVKFVVDQGVRLRHHFGGRSEEDIAAR